MEGYYTGNANALAYLALILWFPICITLFFLLRAFVATSLTLLGASLLLPTRLAFDFPGLPAFNREVIAVLSAFVGCLVVRRGSIRLPRRLGPPEICLLGLILGPVFTASGNADPQQYGPIWLPGITWWDGPAMAFEQFVAIGAPFLLGSGLARRSSDIGHLLSLIVIACFAYSIPILWEVRMSPQLHKIFYGYHAHAFAGTIRYGGYRPIVFLSFGAALALFVASATVAAAVLWRARIRVLGVPSFPLAAYLLGVLLLCKSLAAIVYGVFTLLIVLFATPRLQAIGASAVALIVFAYPLLRAADIFPTQGMVEVASFVDSERAGSLQFRFDNEDRLLTKARQRVWFGWGGWRRNRVLDPRTGRDVSITDGFWIVKMGTLGIFGFVSSMAIVLLPIVGAHRAIREATSQREQVLVAGLALILAFHAIDQIPNATISPITLFIGGALIAVSRNSRRNRLASQGMRVRSA